MDILAFYPQPLVDNMAASWIPAATFWVTVAWLFSTLFLVYLNLRALRKAKEANAINKHAFDRQLILGSAPSLLARTSTVSANKGDRHHLEIINIGSNPAYDVEAIVLKHLILRSADELPELKDNFVREDCHDIELLPSPENSILLREVFRFGLIPAGTMYRGRMYQEGIAFLRVDVILQFRSSLGDNFVHVFRFRAKNEFASFKPHQNPYQLTGVDTGGLMPAARLVIRGDGFGIEADRDLVKTLLPIDVVHALDHSLSSRCFKDEWVDPGMRGDLLDAPQKLLS